MKFIKVVLFLILLVPCISMADLKDENLLCRVPNGYKVDFQNKQNKLITIEMVPVNESVNSWSEMVTVQIFLGLKNVTPDQMKTRLEKLWMATCKDSAGATMKSGVENGYPFTLWLLNCPLNESTGKQEFTFFKAIQGNDSLYLVHKAFKSEPTKEQMAIWIKYLKDAIVCDSRLSDRKCPQVSENAK